MFLHLFEFSWLAWITKHGYTKWEFIVAEEGGAQSHMEAVTLTIMVLLNVYHLPHAEEHFLFSLVQRSKAKLYGSLIIPETLACFCFSFF